MKTRKVIYLPLHQIPICGHGHGNLMLGHEETMRTVSRKHACYVYSLDVIDCDICNKAEEARRRKEINALERKHEQLLHQA